MGSSSISRLRFGCRADPHGSCDARHTAATFLLVQDVDERVVESMAGWTSTAMTTRYQHVVIELVEESIDA